MKRSPLRKVKKSSRGSLVRRLDSLVSKIVRERDKRCVVCGSIDNLQAGHLFTRTVYATRWDLINVNTQCAGCNFRHNGDAYPYIQWFTRRFGEEALEMLHQKHRTITKIKDYELEELLEELKKSDRQSEQTD